MSQAYQTAFLINTLLTMPGLSGRMTLQVPGMNTKNLETALQEIGNVLQFMNPEIQRRGNVLSMPVSDVTVYLKLPQYDLERRRRTAQDLTADLSPDAERNAPTSR